MPAISELSWPRQEITAIQDGLRYTESVSKSTDTRLLNMMKLKKGDANLRGLETNVT